MFFSEDVKFKKTISFWEKMKERKWYHHKNNFKTQF